METPELRPALQVFVCTNLRENGKECCGNVRGMEIFRALKDWVRDRGLSRSVWVTRTGCMTFCNDVGSTLVIHPQNIWMSKVTLSDLPQVQEEILTLAR